MEEVTINLNRRQRMWFGIQRAAVAAVFSLVLVACIARLLYPAAFPKSTMYAVVAIIGIPLCAAVLIVLPRLWLKYPLWRCAHIHVSPEVVTLSGVSGASIASVDPVVIQLLPLRDPTEIWFRNAAKRCYAFHLPMWVLSPSQRTSIVRIAQLNRARHGERVGDNEAGRS